MAARARISRPDAARKWLHRLALVLVTLMVAVLLPMSSASAHVVYQRVELYRSGDMCVNGYAEISHGGGGGFTRVRVDASTRSNTGTDCGTSYSRGARNLAVKTQLWKWDNRGWWWLCRDYPWSYNGSARSWHEETKNFGTQTPCGTGWYGVTGYAYSWNGAWYGGAIQGGVHWLPA